MSYLVLARKYRPALFDEMVGQGHVVRTLKNAVATGRVSHAYLFSGPRGVGKTTSARILAKSLNCIDGPTPDPCNECERCVGITKGSSVDVLEIDGASNTGVDNVRELRESVRYVAGEGGYRIYIIDEVHMLSTPAFNALLKTLEEPPERVVFILATTEVHKIPATILSRCQRFDFKRIPLPQIKEHLEHITRGEGVDMGDGPLFTIAREADGSLRDGQSLLDQVLAFAGGDDTSGGGGKLQVTEGHVSEALGLMDRSMLYDMSEAVLNGDGAGCLNIVENIYNYGYDMKRVFVDLLEHIRDLTVVKATAGETLPELPAEELERLKLLAGPVSIERLHMIFTVASKGYEDLSRSTSPRFSFEMSLLKLASLPDLKPVEELLDALGTLEVPAPPVPSSPSAGDKAVGERSGGHQKKIELSGVRVLEDAPSGVEATGTQASGGSAGGERQESGKVLREPSEGVKEVENEAGTQQTGTRQVGTRQVGTQTESKAESKGSNGGTAGVAGASNRPGGRMAWDKDGRPATAPSPALSGASRPGAGAGRGGVEGEYEKDKSRDMGERPTPLSRLDSDPVLKDALTVLGGRVLEDSRRRDV